MKFQGIDIGAVKQKGISIVEVRQKGILIWPNEVEFILTVIDVRSTEIDLEWTDIAESGQGYYIGRRLPGEEDFIGVGLESGNTFTDENLVPGTTYEYVVILISSDNSTSLRSSNVVSVTIDASAPVYEPETTTFMQTQNIPQDNNPSQYSGLTNNDIWTLFDSVVAYLKTNGEWQNIYHWHPMVGAGAVERGYNAIDINKFYMTFNGSWVFNSMGNVGNGTNTYGNFGFVSTAEMAFENAGMTIVSTQAGTNNAFDYGAVSDGSNNMRLGISYSNTFYVYIGDAKSVSNTARTGIFTANRSGGTVKVFRDGTEILSTTGGGSGLSALESYYGAIQNVASGDVLHGDKTYADAMHHTASNPAVIYEALRMWNQGLGRL